MKRKKICGIYKITSPTNRIYIGQSVNIVNRKQDYSNLICENQPKLCRSIKKYGWENHIFEIIEECSMDDLNCRERFWQDKFDVLNGGLNCILQECGEQKRIISDKVKEKISIGNTGKERTRENKNKISESLKTHYSKNTHPIKGIKRGVINNKLNESQVLKIRELLTQQRTVKELAELFSVSKSTIQQIKDGKTWQSLGEFKKIGKVSRLKTEDLQTLYKLFELKIKVKDIQKILPYCIATIAKQRKIWKQQKENLD